MSDKHFKIQKKKFEIVKGNQRFRTVWLKQENPYDCGPMVIINLLRALGQEHTAGVDALRYVVAQNREGRGGSANDNSGRNIRGDGWLSSTDIAMYLQTIGLSAEVMSSQPDINNVKATLITDVGSAYITGSMQHFRAIRAPYPNRNEYQLLDSMKDGPRTITKAEAEKLLDNSVGTTGVLVKIQD